METTSSKFVLQATVEELQVYGNVRDLHPSKLAITFNQLRIREGYEVSIDFDMKTGDNIFRIRRLYSPEWDKGEDHTQVEIQFLVWKWFCNHKGSVKDQVTIYRDGVYWKYAIPRRRSN